MAKFVRYRLTSKVGASTQAYDFWFLAPPGSYAGIATDAGVTEINDTDIGNVMPLCKVEALLKSSAALRRKLRIKVGTRYKYKSVIVAADKAEAFNAGVLNKTVAGGNVESVVNPLNASFF